MIRIKLIIALVFITNLVFAQGEISVKIDEVESNEGYVYINLYASEDGFPNEWGKAFRQKKLKASEGAMSYTFKDIPMGTYAISIAHDENDNGEVDTNFIGLPKEPVGASNQSGLGKPSFKKSKIDLNTGNSKVSLDMKFLN